MELEEKTETNTLNITNCNESIWLVQVPRSLSEQWKRGSTIGNVKISKKGSTTTIDSINFENQPKNTKFTSKKLDTNISFLISERLKDNSLAIAGKIVGQYTVRTLLDLNSISREPVKLNHTEISINQAHYTPSTIRKNFTNQNMDSHGFMDRKVAVSMEENLNLLISAFQIRPKYTRRDLFDILKQPEATFKEVLERYCDSVKENNTRIYVIKPEYCYSQDKK